MKVPQKQRPRRRLWLNDGSCIRLRPERANQVWSYDFVNARAHDGRLLRILVLIDGYTRECLALRVARRLNLQDVIETLFEVMLWRAIPEHINCGQWAGVCCLAGAGLAPGTGNPPPVYRAGSPWENGYYESLKGMLREECLNGGIFCSLKEARIVIEKWRQQQYNRIRPHAALVSGSTTPDYDVNSLTAAGTRHRPRQGAWARCPQQRSESPRRAGGRAPAQLGSLIRTGSPTGGRSECTH